MLFREKKKSLSDIKDNSYVGILGSTLILTPNIYLEHIKTNDKYHRKSSSFVDSGFVKTCNELVIGKENCRRQFGKSRA